MSLRTSANRYAKALFDVALEENTDLAHVDRDLAAVVEMMKGSPDLALAAGRGSVSDAQRTAMMEAIATAMSRVHCLGLMNNPSSFSSIGVPEMVAVLMLMPPVACGVRSWRGAACRAPA